MGWHRPLAVCTVSALVAFTSIFLTNCASQLPREPKLPRVLQNSLGMEFVLIPAGEFLMGSGWRQNEMPVHRVEMSQPFYLGTYEVTQAQWEAVRGNNPSRFRGDPTRPVENVSWEDVHEFIRLLNAREGSTTYRLPTEAEWEYAARAGTTTTLSFGDDPSQLGLYAWFSHNSSPETHPVGHRQPNAWGLYDMHGNVWEWVHDWYERDYYQYSPAIDPRGPLLGTNRVLRGGAWSVDAEACRSASRSVWHPGYRNNDLGFRVLRAAP